MTVINGYKLVCEWCGCESEDIWTTSNPDKVRLYEKPEHTYISIGCNSNFHDDKAISGPLKSAVYLPENWQGQELYKHTWIDIPKEATVRVGIWKMKTKEIKQVMNTEYKYIYFCGEKHRDSYKRCMKNRNEGWDWN